MTKDKVYAALADQDGYLSGSVLAGMLGISRNSVWKAVTRLRQEGVPIEASPRRGYRLTPDAVLRSAAVQAQLHTKLLGHPLHILPVLSSTNDHLKTLAADGAASGTALIADHQCAGRGRRGRRFYSPPSSGVYMSVLLRGPIPAQTVGKMTSVAAVATAEAIESLLPVQVQIKWVNDLLIDGKKVCGILTEGNLNAETGECDHAIIGIGVNVSTTAFPPELQEVATSLTLAGGKAPDRAALIAAILNRLEKALARMETGAFLAESRRRSAVLGKTVTVLRGNESYLAQAIAIDDDGRLVVDTDAGRRTLSSGEVSLKL